jgi:hypothetical protein
VVQPHDLWGAAPHADEASGEADISPAAAQALEAKFQELSTRETTPQTSYPPIVVTEVEANSYLKYRGQEFLPRGIQDPQIRISPDHISGAAQVDFNQLNPQGADTDDWGLKILAAIFRGKQTVSAVGKLETGDRQGKVTIDKVAVGDTEIPSWLVTWLVQNYVETRYKFDLSKPFALPDHVTHIELGTGRAIFHRRPAPNR